VVTGFLPFDAFFVFFSDSLPSFPFPKILPVTDSGSSPQVLLAPPAAASRDSVCSWSDSSKQSPLIDHEPTTPPRETFRSLPPLAALV